MQFFPLPLLMPFIPVSIGYKQCRNRAIYAGMVIVSFGLLKKVKKKNPNISHSFLFLLPFFVLFFIPGFNRLCGEK